MAATLLGAACGEVDREVSHAVTNPPVAPFPLEAPDSTQYATQRADESEPALETGRWRKARLPSPASGEAMESEDEDRYQQLLALGYATGTQAPSGQGITVHDDSRAFQGYNFYTSAHDEVAVLMDMQGKVLHEWRKPFSDFVEGPPPSGDKVARWWRRGWLLENGDVVALNSGTGIMRIDKDSNVLWHNTLYVHHDLVLRKDGGYIALTRKVHVIPRIRADSPVVEDMVVYLDARGEVERSLSILEAFERSPFKEAAMAGALRRQKTKRDLFHTNSIALLDGRLANRHSAFAAGNLLLSFRPLNAIGILDPKSETMVWFHQGDFVQQHDPKILANGNLLLFDNKGAEEGSRILELDPLDGEIRWQYEGSPEAPFYTGTCGVADELPNGNVLITESNNGRVFEVTRKGEIVWEFLSPHRAGEAGEFVATLPELIRLPMDFPLGWLREAAATTE